MKSLGFLSPLLALSSAGASFIGATKPAESNAACARVQAVDAVWK
jgi:hypothetical protein